MSSSHPGEMAVNSGMEFDSEWIEKSCVNKPAVEKYVKNLLGRSIVKNEYSIAWLLRAVTCVDLTTLSGDDSFSNVQRLCFKASRPIQNDLLEPLGFSNDDIHVAAVCVYPARVSECKTVFLSLKSNIPIAAVAAGFPSGQYHLKTRLQEISEAVTNGANEIDIVINRDFALRGEWQALYEEVKMMRAKCGSDIKMKTIIAAGELGSLTNVYKASITCMMAGADFIKTSTGKECVNATFPIGVIMTRAIKDYYEKTGIEVGFKPAGGIKTAKDVISWLILMKEELGNKWLFPNLFRVGASSLLQDVEKQIYNYVTGNYASPHLFPFA